MKRRLVAAAVVVAVGMGVEVASAAFNSSGTGAGHATSGALTALTISATAATPTSRLLPSTTADAVFMVSNPNAVAVTVVSVVRSGIITVSGGAGCTSANDAVTFSDQSGLSISVPASASNVVIDLPNSVTMGSNANNGCQGATFSVPVTVTVHQG